MPCWEQALKNSWHPGYLCAGCSCHATRLPWRKPVTGFEYLTDFRSDNPRWDQAISWIPIAEPAPVLASWRKVRFILEDAAWQVFQPTVTIEQIPQILGELDDMVPEVLQH
jgi:hypothetical protein